MSLRSPPILETKHPDLSRAFRVAIGDLCSNLVHFRGGALTEPRVCLAAGLDYGTPWTRDTAVNTWNGAGLLLPDACRNGLQVVLERDGDGWRIGGQYWDAIIWAQGAWQYYLYTGDRDFLREAEAIVCRSLGYFDRTEFDAGRGLYRGPAFFQDGIAAYPDDCAGAFGSDVRDWPRENGPHRASPGFGIPWFALSTNCLYARAFALAGAMRHELGLPPDATLDRRAQDLRTAIHRTFRRGPGQWTYLLTHRGPCDQQEAAGLAFLILFGLVDDAEADAIVQHATVLPAGIPCVWPTFPRYAAFGAGHFGRHSGTVWPHVQAFFADAARRRGRIDRFSHELLALAGRAVRDGQFSELYHPITGAIYGGVQEDHLDSHLRLWDSVPHTLWGATGYLRLVFMALFGMEFSPGGITFSPTVPAGIGPLRLQNLPYREAMLDLEVSGSGHIVQSLRLNGEPASRLPATATGRVHVEIQLATP